MLDGDEEHPLPGGHLYGAVRRGDTVRRHAGPWTPTIHALLDHLRDRGVSCVPRPLGLDESGREVLEYVEGETVGSAYPWPSWVWDEGLLAEVGRTVAELHVAARDFRPSEIPFWQFSGGWPKDGEIVGHFDLAPYNVVVRDGRLRAFIDWDLARPLSPRAELAFVAWEWVPLWHPESARGLGWDTPPDLRRRLSVLLDSYGLEDRRGFIDEVIESVRLRASEMSLHAAEGIPGYVQLVADGQLENIERTEAHLREHRDELQALVDD